MDVFDQVKQAVDDFNLYWKGFSATEQEVKDITAAVEERIRRDKAAHAERVETLTAQSEDPARPEILRKLARKELERIQGYTFGPSEDETAAFMPGANTGEGERGRPLLFSCLELSRSTGKATAGQLFTPSENPHPVRVTSSGQNAGKFRDILRQFHGTGCGREPGHKERARDQPRPFVLCLFRKYFAQVDEATIQDVNPCHAVPAVFLTDPEGAAAVQREHLDRFVFRIDNPVFTDPGPLVQAQLYKSVMPERRRGQDFNHQIGSTLAPVLVYLAPVTHHGQIRLDHRVNVFRGFPVPLEEPDAKGGRVDLAPLPLQVVPELPGKFGNDFLMDAGRRGHHNGLTVDDFYTLVIFPCKAIGECIPRLFCW